jgi:vacuolar iron transporter family protein
MSEQERLISGLKQAWRDEMASARNYRALAKREPNPEKSAILLRLAEAEDKHAMNWAARLKELGADPGEYTRSLAEQARRWALVQSGTDTAVVKLEALEDGADAMYDDLAKIAPSEEVRKQLVEAQTEERSHSRVLSEFTEGSVPPAQRKLNKILGTERWHVTGAGWIGQAIYGVNDGLGAAFGVVSGVAGATDVNGKFVLLSGLATAIASALSMGSGAYLATKSEREVYEAEIERERMEIETEPEQEREEMELFYQLKGFSARKRRRWRRNWRSSPSSC